MMSYSKPIIIGYIIIIVFTCYTHIYANGISLLPNNNAKVPAFLVFGDSIVDPGNNDYIDTIGKANFPPYGKDFEGGVATGRFSNGKIPSDLLAEQLGVKELIPPYLDPTLKISDLLTGVSFASAASGYDPESDKLANTLSFEDQLKMFREYIIKLRAAVGDNTTSYIISESLYLVCAGSNDITNTYFGVLPFRRLQYNTSAYTTQLVTWASTFVQELYKLGARKIAVISAPPCGCLPSQRTLIGGIFRMCVHKENKVSQQFNDKLSTELTSLNQKLSGTKIAYLDIYTPLDNLMSSPSHYGFKVSDRGCCGTGELEASFLCNKFDIGTCKDASKFVFWDAFHPTEAAYRYIVQDIYPKYIQNMVSQEIVSDKLHVN